MSKYFRDGMNIKSEKKKKNTKWEGYYDLKINKIIITSKDDEECPAEEYDSPSDLVTSQLKAVAVEGKKVYPENGWKTIEYKNNYGKWEKIKTLKNQ